MKFLHHKTPEGLDWLAAEGLTEGCAVHAFSTRLGGVSTGHLASLNLGIARGDDPENVRENYRRWSAAVGFDAAKMVFSHQVHRDEIRVCTMADAGKGLDRPRDYEADGLITDVPGLPLVIFSADCIPILLCDPVRRVVGGCHAGWRGTALGIAGKTVRRMREVYGCNPADIRCAIGPGISRCCFETHADVPEAMAAAIGSEAARFIDPTGEGKYRVNLKSINGYWLEKAGISPKKIVISDDCTACHPDIYWSHRHTGAARGSMAAVIQLL